MAPGLIILIVIVAILIIHFLGFTVFLICIPVALLGVIIAFFYPILRDEGRIMDFSKLPKESLKKYKKWESKLFKWFDDL